MITRYRSYTSVGMKGGDNMEVEKFGNGWTVFYCGDEIYFDTYEEAEQFIKDHEGEI